MKKVIAASFAIILNSILYVPMVRADQAFQIIDTSLSPNAYIGQEYTSLIGFVYSGTCTPVATLVNYPTGIGVLSIIKTGADLYTVGIGGTPVVVNNYNKILLILSDSCGATITQTYSLNVVNYIENTGNNFIQPGMVGAEYNSDISFSSTGILTASWSGLPSGITGNLKTGNVLNTSIDISNSLPSGSMLPKIYPLTITDYGVVLSGVPTQAGNYNVTLTLSDFSTSKSFSYLLVVSPSTILKSSTPTNSISVSAPTSTVVTNQPTNSLLTIPSNNSVQQSSETDSAGTNVISSGTVYMITTNGQKRPYTSAGAFLSYGFNSWANVIPASSADLALPTGSFIPPRDGKIICSNKGSDKSTCYLITDSKKAAFTSAAVFKALGFSFSNTLSGDVSFLDSAPNISSASQAHPAGVLINNGGTIYIMGDSGLLGIPDMATLTSWGYSLTDSVKANAADSAFTQTGVMATHTAGALSPFGN